MLTFNQNYEVDQKMLKCDFIRYSQSKVSTINTGNSQIIINIPMEEKQLLGMYF